MRLITAAEVDELLTMPDCIDVMRRAFLNAAAMQYDNPLRIKLKPERGTTTLLGLMPAFRSEPDPVYGLKAAVVAPENSKRGLDPHQGVVVLFDGTTGQLRGLVDATAITRIRTAAVTGVATDAFARRDATSLALIGCGHQAAGHLTSIGHVRGLTEVRVFSPTRSRVESFIDAAQPTCDAKLIACASAAEAVDGADIVTTLTNAKEPVLQASWLAPGVHVNAVGASVPPYRELDTDTVVSSRFFVDSRQSAENEALDFLVPLREGAVTADHIAGELGEVLAGAVPGRTSAEDRTVFKSLGLAFEDLEAASHVVALAAARGSA